jgi:LacI family transcriptional regulator
VPHRNKQIRVAIAVPQGLSFLERLLHGIAEFARGHGGWTFTRLPDALGASIDWLRHWSGDGAFALVTTPSDMQLARRLPFPVVNLASHLPPESLPTVTVDHGLAGEMAARHLIERSFRRFGFFGAGSLWFSRLRRDRFLSAVAGAGGECRTLEIDFKPGSRHWRNQGRQLQDWLASLTMPVGILASTDLRAAMILEACRQLALRVPEDVAIIGVDNDPVVTEFADPPLTSISRNDQEVGMQAAGLLSRLMAGDAPPPGPLFVPPSGIVQRQSTETVAVDDPLIGQAVRYIRENLQTSFGVENVLEKMPLSRRSLEYRFQRALGISPYDFINRMRIDAAKRLLADPTRIKMTAVSEACGFHDPRRFRLVFRRLTGMTPAAFRRSHAASSKSTSAPV